MNAREIKCVPEVNHLVIREFVETMLWLESINALLPGNNLTTRLEDMLQALEDGKNMYWDMTKNTWYTVSDEGKLGTRDMMERILRLVPAHFTSTHYFINCL